MYYPGELFRADIANVLRHSPTEDDVGHNYLVMKHLAKALPRASNSHDVTVGRERFPATISNVELCTKLQPRKLKVGLTYCALHLLMLMINMRLARLHNMDCSVQT